MHIQFLFSWRLWRWARSPRRSEEQDDKWTGDQQRINHIPTHPRNGWRQSRANHNPTVGRHWRVSRRRVLVRLSKTMRRCRWRRTTWSCTCRSVGELVDGGHNSAIGVAYACTGRTCWSRRRTCRLWPCTRIWWLWHLNFSWLWRVWRGFSSVGRLQCRQLDREHDQYGLGLNCRLFSFKSSILLLKFWIACDWHQKCQLCFLINIWILYLYTRSSTLGIQYHIIRNHIWVEAHFVINKSINISNPSRAILVIVSQHFAISWTLQSELLDRPLVRSFSQFYFRVRCLRWLSL